MRRIEHNEESLIFPFVEYIPDSADGRLPLIVQLHGAGERGSGGDALGLVDVHGFSELIRDKEINCRFVMPQCPENTFWAARVESLLSFIEELKRIFEVDEKRIYLTGCSMGGFGTWFTAMAAPELFAAIAPVCGGGMEWNAGVLKMPVWAFHGALDGVVDPMHSRLMAEAIERSGGNVRLTVVEGVGHDVWDHAYRQELLDWMLSKAK